MPERSEAGGADRPVANYDGERADPDWNPVAIRDIDEPFVKSAPPGAIVLGVARHIGAGEPRYDKDARRYHDNRASRVHQLVDQTNARVLDWDTLDDVEHSREVVEVVIALGPAVITAIAQVVSTWLGRRTDDEADSPTVLGVGIKRPDGTNISFKFPRDTDPDEVIKAIEALVT